MTLLQSGWFRGITGCVLYLGVTGFLLRPANLLNGTHPATVAARSNEKSPSWEFSNPELDRLTTELKKEKEALGTKEQQLNELAARLEAERAEINIVTQTVHRLQREFDRNVVRIPEQETANLKKLGKTYATMSPEGAATIFKQMEDDQVVKILVFMKEGETAPVLESFARLGEAEAKRAAVISERLRTSIPPRPAAKP